MIYCQTVAANTVDIFGATTTQTCTVEVDGTNNNTIIFLPIVAIEDLQNPASAAGETWFEFSLRGCISSRLEDVYVTKLIGETSAGGNLANNGSANNVVLQLMSSDKAPIDLNRVPSLELDTNPNLGEAKTELGVRYLTEQGNATSGSIIANLEYLITYR
jgi:Fimbrial protein.